MLDLIDLVSRKIDDPIVFEWAVNLYRNTRSDDDVGRRFLEEKWFNDIALGNLLNRGPARNILGAFRALPASRFGNLSTILFDRWKTWPDYVAGMASRVLLKVDPDQMIGLWESELRRLETNATTSISRIADIALSPGFEVRHQQLVQGLANHALKSSVDDFERQFLSSVVLANARHLEVEQLINLLALATKPGAEVLKDGQPFRHLFGSLFGGSEFLDLMLARTQGHSDQRVADLSMLFEDITVLAQIDDLIGRSGSEDSTADSLALLNTVAAKSSAAEILQVLVNQTGQNRQPVQLPTRKAIVLGAALHALKKAQPEFDQLALPDAVALLSCDLATLDCYPALLERLCTFGQPEVIAELIKTLPGLLHHYGSRHVIRAMGDLGWEDFVPALIDCLEDEHGDFVCSAAEDALTQIGFAAQSQLINVWQRLDASQKIFGHSVIRKIGGAPVAEFLLARFDELLADSVEEFCETATVYVDLRVLDRLRPLLSRKSPFVDKAFTVLAELLDVQDEESQAARIRAHASLASMEQQRLRLETGDFHRDHLDLDLACPHCAAIHRYEVRSVLVYNDAQKQQQSSACVADEFNCESCGKSTDLALTESAKLAISAELVMASVTQDPEADYRLIRSFECKVEGQAMSFEKALALLIEQARSKPENALGWFRVATLLCRVNRPKATEEAFRQAISASPKAADIRLRFAQYLSSNEQHEEAFTELRQVIQDSAGVFMMSPQASFGREFADLYNQLRRQLGRVELPVVHPSVLNFVRAQGRNDPCACGSGKKFKRCCGQ